MVNSDSKLRWHSNPKLTLVVLALLPVLLSLGFWQLSRADEKRLLLKQQQHLEQLPPVEVKDQQELLQSGRLVKLTGNFQNEQNIILENRIFRGRYGVEVVTPLQTTKGKIVLVNRGWMPADLVALDNIEVEQVEGLVEIEARIYKPSRDNPFASSEIDEDQNWPKRIQTLDPKKWQEEFGEGLHPYEVRLEDGQIGLLERNWVTVSVKPEKHTAYAVQWFAMFVVLIAAYVAASSNFFSWITGIAKRNRG